MNRDFILYLFINSMFIFGLYISLDKDQILGYVGKKIRKIPYEFLQKPLSECPPCMASLWGTLFFLILPIPFYLYPVYIICLTGINFIINNQLK